jgi:hypothetical protein
VDLHSSLCLVPTKLASLQAFYTPVLPCLFVCAIRNLSLGVKRCGGHTNHNHSLILLHLIPPLCDKMQWGLWYVPLALLKNCQSFYTCNALIKNSLVCLNATLLYSQKSLLPKEEGSYTHSQVSVRTFPLLDPHDLFMFRFVISFTLCFTMLTSMGCGTFVQCGVALWVSH